MPSRVPKSFSVRLFQHHAPSAGDAFLSFKAMTISEVDLISRGDIMLIWLEGWDEVARDMHPTSFSETLSYHSPLLQHSLSAISQMERSIPELRMTRLFANCFKKSSMLKADKLFAQNRSKRTATWTASCRQFDRHKLHYQKKSRSSVCCPPISGTRSTAYWAIVPMACTEAPVYSRVRTR